MYCTVKYAIPVPSRGKRNLASMGGGRERVEKGDEKKGKLWNRTRGQVREYGNYGSKIYAKKGKKKGKRCIRSR